MNLSNKNKIKNKIVMTKLLFTFLLYIALHFIGTSIYAQTPTTGQLKNSVWTNAIRTTLGTTNTVSLNVADYSLPSTLPPIPSNATNPSKVSEAFVKVAFSPKQNKFLNVDYNYTLTFDLVARNNASATSTICMGCKLTVSNKIATSATSVAENQLVTNIKDILYNTSIPIPAYTNITTLDLKVTSVVNNTTPSIALTPLQLADLDIFMEIAVGYGVKVQNIQIANFSQGINNKTATFSWAATPYIPNYEIEVLRLNNKVKITGHPLQAQILAEEVVITNIDWSKALRIETQSNQLSTNLTLAEGKGFYIWRMRPIGNYEPNGSGNSKNHGVWSIDNQNTLTIQRFPLVTPPSISVTDANNVAQTLPVFFFDDPDNDVNNIYSRTFTEGNRNKEVISYANGLQQSKQTQSYIPSQKTQVTVQTIYDNLGRPVITTLPVPTESMSGSTNTNIGLKGYKQKFAQNNLGDLYNPDDFDIYNYATNEDKLKNPNPIKGVGTDFDYYSGKNNVADAEGYPFTRTLYYNDGVGRVKEQSGVGKKHALGKEVDGKGKTVKTYYSTSSEQELVRLFGKEAPDAKSVLKTITVDQNNIASITYTSKEGKVIATCLAIFDGAATSPLLELDGLLPTSNIINDAITSDTKNGESTTKSIITSRRMAFGETTTLSNINYTLNCNRDPLRNGIITIGCFEFKPDSKFKIELVIRKIDEVWNASTLNGLSSNWEQLPDIASVPAPATNKIYTIARSTTVSCDSPAASFGSITLETGSYIIEKRLTLLSQGIDMTDISNKDIAPFAGLIKSWLEDVKCNKQFDLFYQKVDLLDRELKYVRDVIANVMPTPISPYPVTTPLTPAPTFANLDLKYGLGTVTTPFFNTYHRLQRDGFDAIVLTAKCCRGIRVPIGNISPFDCDNIKLVDVVNGTQLADQYVVNPFFTQLPEKTEFFPDFEGYAYAYFFDCIPASGLASISNETTFPYPQYVYQPVANDLSKLRSLFKGTDAQYAILSTDTAKLAYYHSRIKYIYYKILKDQMTGWHTPGTFNAMVYHMLTDKYSTDGRQIVVNNGVETEVVVNTKPEPLIDECGGTIYPNFASTSVVGGNITHTYYNNENITQANFNAGLVAAAANQMDLGRENTTHYYCADLFKCWANNLAFVKNELGSRIDPLTSKPFLICPDGIVVPITPSSSSFSQTVDENSSPNDHDGQYNDHIDGNWFVSWFVEQLISIVSDRVRGMQFATPNQVSAEAGNMAGEDVGEGKEKLVYHLVSEFLNCTGYRFGKIITDYDEKPLDIDTDPAYTYPKPKAPDLTRRIPLTNAQLPTYSGTPLVKYKPIVDVFTTPTSTTLVTPGWEVWQLAGELPTTAIRQLFRSVKNPIYAFKYFEYKEETFPQIETVTCFADPNWRKVNVGTVATPNVRGVFLKTGENGKNPTLVDALVGGVTPTTATPVVDYSYEIDGVTGRLKNLPSPVTPKKYTENELCEICGIGFVKCKITQKLWSQGQRYTFYTLINQARTPPPMKWTNAEASAKDFASVGYVRSTGIAPNATRNFYLWEDETKPLDIALYNSLVLRQYKKPTGERYKTKVELDLAKYNTEVIDWCGSQRDNIRTMLVEELTAKCYIISDAYCRAEVPTTGLTPEQIAIQTYNNEQIISNSDIDKLVEVMVNECKTRGMLTTYRRSKTGCRDLYVPVKVTDNAGVVQWNLGYRDYAGVPIEVPRVEYGVGKGDENATLYSSEIYKRDVANGAIGTPNNITIVPNSIFPAPTNTMKTTIFSFNQTTGIYATIPANVLDLTPIGTTSDVEEFNETLHNYCQWNKRRQVLEMFLKAKLKSFCNPTQMPTPYVTTPITCPGGDCSTMPSMPGQATTQNQPYQGPPNTDINGGSPRRVSPGVKVKATIKVTSGRETVEVVSPTP